MKTISSEISAVPQQLCPRLTRSLLLLLLLVAATRLIAVYLIHPRVAGPQAIVDSNAYEHAQIAESLATGRGFRLAFYSTQPLPSSHQAPAIPFLLAAAYELFGFATPASFVAVELFNVFLSLFGALALAFIANSLYSHLAACWSLAAFALYPPLVYMVTKVQAVNWSVSLLLLTIAASIAASHRKSISLWALAGLIAGLGLLGEPILIAPFLLLAIFTLVRSPRAATTFLLAIALTISPWLARNTLVHHRFVFIKSTFWYVLWQGNNPAATGTDKLLPNPIPPMTWSASPRTAEIVLTASREQSQSIDSTLTPTEISSLLNIPTEITKMNFFRDRILPYLLDHPAHYLHMCLSRLWQIFWFDPTNPRSYLLAYRLPYLLLLALAILGITKCRTKNSRLASLPLLAALGIIAIHTLTITSARFRLPVEALMLLPTAALLSKSGATIAPAVPSAQAIKSV